MTFIRQSVHSLCQAVKQRLRQWTQPDNHSLIRNAALDITRPKSELVLENALLRQQLILLQRQIKRPKLTHLDRSIIVLLASKLRTWKEALLIVQPGTVLRWHRDLFKRFWTRKSKPKQKQGRPPLTDDLVALIKCMVKENLTWGAERIRGELLGETNPNLPNTEIVELINKLTWLLAGQAEGAASVGAPSVVGAPGFEPGTSTTPL